MNGTRRSENMRVRENRASERDVGRKSQMTRRSSRMRICEVFGRFSAGRKANLAGIGRYCVWESSSSPSPFCLPDAIHF